jgi:hypothetical protein
MPVIGAHNPAKLELSAGAAAAGVLPFVKYFVNQIAN